MRFFATISDIFSQQSPQITCTTKGSLQVALAVGKAVSPSDRTGDSSMFEKLMRAMASPKTNAPRDVVERLEVRAFRVNNDHNLHIILHTPDGDQFSQVIAKGLSERDASRMLRATRDHLAEVAGNILQSRH